MQIQQVLTIVLIGALLIDIYPEHLPIQFSLRWQLMVTLLLIQLDVVLKFGLESFPR